MNMDAKRLAEFSDKNIIVFDGECVLCSAFFKFVLKHDQENQFHFATAQSEFGEALYEYFGLKGDDYDTNLVLVEGQLFERMHAFFKVMDVVGYPWKGLTVFSVLPNRFLDWAYYRIARNRYALFGRRDTCLVPDASVKARFIDD